MTHDMPGDTVLTALDHVVPPFVPDGAEAITGLLELPMLTLVEPAELKARRDRRHPRPAAG